MALLFAADYKILINAVDMSTLAQAVNVDVEAAELETTAMGASGQWQTFIAGLKKGHVSLIFNQDYAAAQADALMWPLFAGPPVAFDVKPTSAAAGAGNPRYTGSILVTKWQPITAKIGDLSIVSVSFPTTGVVLRQIV